MINLKNARNLLNAKYRKRYLNEIKIAKAAVEPIKRGITPILIHQMGKVGSTTLVNSINQSSLENPAFHTHFITKPGIRVNWAVETQNYSNNAIPKHLMMGIELEKLLIDHPDQEILIICSVRELIARQVSMIYQAPFLAEKNIRNQRRQIDPVLASSYLNKFIEQKNAFNYPHKWFKEELLDAFGIDVFAHEFDTDKGLSIIEKGKIKLMLIRMNKINEFLPNEISQFLGAEKPIQVVHKNVRKASGYEETQKLIKLDPDLLDRIYRLPFMTHFYSEKERESFKNKWSI
ncbi:MAG: putative capsular polysaccharide synthesis family protein [Nonlabens sp.]